MKLAFVIGCGKYDDPDIAPLSYAGSDASRFAKIIALNCGFAAEEIRLLTTDNESSKTQPTKSNILRELSRGRSSATFGTRVEQIFFFFSGHGFHSQNDGEDYLVPQDAVYTALEESAIPFSSIVKHLKSWSSAPIILFIDACRAVVESGKNIDVDGVSKINVEALHAYGMASFASCSPHQKSYEADGLMAGIFTYSLVEALSDTGKCKTIYELDSYLGERSPQLSKQYGKPIQIPFSRVEPLNIQDTVLVSEQIANKWKAQIPIGREIRKNKISHAANLLIGADIYYAIDFGTSYSSISVLNDTNEIIQIPSPQRRSLIPSVVSFFSNLDYLVGVDAVENARIRPESTIFGVKRLIGSGKLINIEGHALSPEFVASLIIKSLKKNAEDYLSSKVDKVIAAVPANFNIAQCNALAKAFELADLSLFRLIGEPCASSVLLDNHELFKGKDDWFHLLVLDLGGGTFDVSYMEYVPEGIFETVGIAGDNNLGGIDYDIALQTYIHSEIERLYTGRCFTPNDFDQFQMKAEAERAKIALGSLDATDVILQDVEVEAGRLVNLRVPLSRETFRKITADLNERVKSCLEEAIKQAYKDSPRNKIDAIVLAGQGAKVFTVQEILKEMFIGVPVISDYQENAVVTGLCKYSGVFLGREGSVLLVDINYTAIGISCPDIAAITGYLFQAPRDIEANDKQVFEVLPLNTNIPTLRWYDVHFRDCRGKTIIKLLEISPAHMGEEYSEIGNIIIEAEQSITSLYLIVSVDANRTIVVSIANPISNEVHEYQINNFFAKARSDLEGRVYPDVLRPNLSNYTFRPIQKLSSSGIC